MKKIVLLAVVMLGLCGCMYPGRYGYGYGNSYGGYAGPTYYGASRPVPYGGYGRPVMIRPAPMYMPHGSGYGLSYGARRYNPVYGQPHTYYHSAPYRSGWGHGHHRH